MTAPVLTIVIPAHDIEDYIEDCLASVVTQSAWPSCRVVVVDDGSTDATAARADAVAALHPAVTVVRQPQSGPGPGVARNHGLELVDTELVMFLDGDDELAPDAVARLLSAAQEHKTPVVVGRTEQFPHPRTWEWSDYFVGGGTRAVTIDEVPLLVHNSACCNKLFRTAWVREQGLRFTPRIHHQDAPFVVPALLDADRIALVADVVHRYRKRADGSSIMDGQYTRADNHWDQLQVIEELSGHVDRLAPGRRALLESYIARAFQGYSWRAVPVLDHDRLPEFFARARAVISRIPVEVIASATRTALDRTAYVTMIEDDLDAFLRLEEHSRRLEAHGRRLRLAVPTTSATTERLLVTPLPRAAASLAPAEGDSPAGLLVSVRVPSALDLPGGVEQVCLRLADRDRADVVELELDLRPGDRARSRWTWEARVGLDRMPSGSRALDVVVRTRSGDVEVPVTVEDGRTTSAALEHTGGISVIHLPGPGSAERFCPVCHQTSPAPWRPGPGGRPDATCPHCVSMERERFLAVLVEGLMPALAGCGLLVDIAPSRNVTRLLERLRPGRRVGVDVDPAADGRAVDVRASLTDLPFPDGSVDVLVCSHVLEHIPDDGAAMREIARVLTGSGLALVQVPWRPGARTDEDPAAPVEERVRRFGQADHVRFYGADFEDRLAAAGLGFVRLTPRDYLGVEACRWMHLVETEALWIVRRAGRECLPTLPSRGLGPVLSRALARESPVSDVRAAWLAGEVDRLAGTPDRGGRGAERRPTGPPAGTPAADRSSSDRLRRLGSRLRRGR